MDNLKFTPTKDMWYLYFNFYTNTQEEIDNFKMDLKSKYDFILGFVQNTGSSDSKKILVYVSTEEDCKALKNDETLNIFQKYVGDNGYEVS